MYNMLKCVGGFTDFYCKSFMSMMPHGQQRKQTPFSPFWQLFFIANTFLENVPTEKLFSHFPKNASQHLSVNLK